MQKERLYKSDISTARWIAYDLPGNVGWILYLVGSILLLVDPQEYMADAALTVLGVISVIPALLMIVGIAELISERMHKLDRMLPCIRLLRGFGALTLGGILGTAVAAAMLIYAVIGGAGDMLYVWLMLAGGILCGLFAGPLYKKYKGNTAQLDARISLAYYSVILHRNSLTCASKPASFLYNLTKNLAAQSTRANCAV